MDTADAGVDDGPAADRYLLALWPAGPAPDVVVRRTGAVAEFWHREAQSRPAPSAR